ncbi:hypothetical protein V2J09_011198 [Rumex salicifolius]
MVVAAKAECGAQPLSANLRRTVQSLKELTGNPSDTEVYAALKECHMDANEAAQKLLNQGFKEFSDNRKQPENVNYRKQAENAKHRKHSENENNRKQPENANQRKQPENANHIKQPETENAKHRKQPETENANHSKQPENANHTAKIYAPDRRFNNVRRATFSRNNMHETVQPVSREFRVVRDNRVNPKLEKETESAIDAGPAPGNHSSMANIFETSAMGSSRNHKLSAQDHIPQHVNRTADSRPKLAREINLTGQRKEQTEEKKPAVPSSVSNPQAAKQGHLPSSTFVEGVCASPSDPVHVPSSNSRSPAIKREVGVVGGHRQSVECSPKQTSQQNSSNSNLVQGSSSTMGSFRSINNASKKDQPSNSTISQSTLLNTSRAFFSQHHASRQYQAPVGHQKGALPSKEWRPKSSQMVKVSTAGVVGTPLKSASLSSDNSKIQKADPSLLHEEISEVSIEQVQNVIIAQHIRVPENDRCRLTFGSFGMDISYGDSASALQATGGQESATTGSDEISDRTQLNLLDEGVRNSGSSSSSDVANEQVHDEEKTTTSLHLESYSDTGLERESGPPFSASELQQHQDTSDLPNFAVFDPQAGYDISYFRHVDDTVQEQTFPSQEVLASHSPTNAQASSMAMLQQQPPLAQMYPQLHLSHYTNVMPYRQLLSPVYVPPMGLPGYSNNPTYGHPSNGSSYVLMPGGSSHLTPANMKYSVQPFKPLPSVSAAGFGNFGTPTGYAINAPGIAETSEVWIQNPREHPGMQSAPYYNMQGQSGHHHAAYMQTHASFNPGGVPQSSHMQFPGVYQPPPNPHHMGPPAPGPQVGPYQQQQLGHLNWTTNF